MERQSFEHATLDELKEENKVIYADITETNTIQVMRIRICGFAGLEKKSDVFKFFIYGDSRRDRLCV